MASRVCKNGTQNYKIEHCTLECEGCDIYSSWAVWKDHGSFLTQTKEDFMEVQALKSMHKTYFSLAKFHQKVKLQIK
jgi:hypothetical protein